MAYDTVGKHGIHNSYAIMMFNIFTSVSPQHLYQCFTSDSIKEESSEDEGTLKETENEKGVGDEPAEEPVHQSSLPIVKPVSQPVPIVKPVSQPVRRPTEPETAVSPVAEKEEEVGTKKLFNTIQITKLIY